MSFLNIQNKLSSYIRDKLDNVFPNHSIISFDKNTKNPGLESSIYYCTIEFMDLKNNKIQKDLVLKVYDGINSLALFDSNESAKIEYNVLKFLSLNDIPTPNAYAFESSSNSYFSSSFVIMDYIHGIPFPKLIKDLQNEGKNDEMEKYWQKLMLFMDNIENLDFSTINYLFPDAINGQNPYYYLFHDLNSWEQILKSKNVEIEKFQELFQWLESNKIPISKYSLINRDYRAGNFIVSDGEVILLDWSKCYISDFRLSLGFTLMGLLFHPEMTPSKEQFLSLYERTLKKNVENIDYFIALALLKDLSIGYMLSMYHKNDYERDEILMDYQDSYSLLVNLTKHEFPILKGIFKSEKTNKNND